MSVFLLIMFYAVVIIMHCMQAVRR